MIEYTTAKSAEDLKGILSLQARNLSAHLSRDEILSQGFVTVSHTRSALQKMHDIEPSIIARDEGKVIGYVLAMTVRSAEDIPILKPMFDVFKTLTFRDSPLTSRYYLVIGQVCIDKPYRGQGVFDKMYEAYKNRFRHKYDLAITEISSRNQRSLRAHQRLGFSTIHTYVAPDGETWEIVVWDWR